MYSDVRSVHVDSQAVDQRPSPSKLLPAVDTGQQAGEGPPGVGYVSVRGPAQELEVTRDELAFLELRGGGDSERGWINTPNTCTTDCSTHKDNTKSPSSPSTSCSLCCFCRCLLCQCLCLSVYRLSSIGTCQRVRVRPGPDTPAPPRT